MAEDGALRFAERLLALLDATRYSATYKLAALLALFDVAAERTGPDGSAPGTLPAKEVGRRVIELYWPQTVPYGAAAHGEPRVLSQAPQNDIPAKLAAWRAARRLPPGASVEDARAADPRIAPKPSEKSTLLFLLRTAPMMGRTMRMPTYASTARAMAARRPSQRAASRRSLDVLPEAGTSNSPRRSWPGRPPPVQTGQGLTYRRIK